MSETVALSRSKRATAGNRMRELLEKAHQQDDDEMFKEEDDDEEFAAPQDIRDVYLDDFADTDDEVEVDEDEEERRIRREERRKAKGKSKAGYNPLVKPKKVQFPSGPSQTASTSTSGIELLDPSIDPSTMAPSTLLLTMRKQRRDAKRQNRSEAIRSTLRASTLKTEQAILEKEQAKADSGRKGRKAQHHGGEPRGGRKMTQDELIAAALEEEERNKESLRDWLKREEQRRELRRVGRKRVRGPRWTWVSRTVGRLVEEVEPAAHDSTTPGMTEQVQQGEARDTPAAPATALPPVIDTQPSNAEAGPSRLPAEVPMTAAPTPAHIEATPDASSDAVNPSAANPPLPTEAALQQYTRNYLILSQVPGGLAAELQLILGDHVEWDKVQYIPHRNRPINRRPLISPFSGLPARYRHPETKIPYGSVQEYKQIEALLRHRYMWNEEASAWYGGEADLGAEGVEEVEGWAEAVHGGWYEGREIVREVAEVEATPEVVPEPEAVATPEPKKRGPKRKSMAVEPKSNKRSKQATDPVSSPATHGLKRKK